jgi:hypothetical protein
MNKLRLILMLLVSMMMLMGCNKWDDQPELVIEPWNPSGSRIFDIGGRHVLGKAFGSAPDSIVTWEYDKSRCCIRGVVVSSDEGGNFYKSMVIQDETGAVALQLDLVGLHTSTIFFSNFYRVYNPVISNCKATAPVAS